MLTQTKLSCVLHCWLLVTFPVLQTLAFTSTGTMSDQPPDSESETEAASKVREGRRLIRKRILVRKPIVQELAAPDNNEIYGNLDYLNSHNDLYIPPGYVPNPEKYGDRDSYDGPDSYSHYDSFSAPSYNSSHHHHHHHHQPQEESKVPRFARVFTNILDGTNAKIETHVTAKFPIPFCQFKNSPCTTFDIDVPFTYELPNSTAALVYSGRRIEDEHAAVFEMAEDLLNKFGIDGKSCVLRLICELAESRGLPYNGLLGRAFETLFLLDYGLSNTDRLYEYISARMYGEHQGSCASAYPQCPFSAFNLLDPAELLKQASQLP